MKKLFVITLGLVALFLSGCVTQNAAKQFAEFERLGITEATITGKFSNTDYTVTTKDGKRRAEINHSNAWVPKIHIVRETPFETK